jgi:hypothetical protein
VVVLVVWVSSVAEARTDGTPEAQRVEITLVGELNDDPAFPSRVSSWFDREKFELAMRTAPQLDAQRVLLPDRASIVFVWATFSSKNRVRLFFASRASAEATETLYLLRELELEHGLDEIGAERVAQVLYLSTIALLEGQEHSGREEIERGLEQSAPPPEPAPHPPAPRRGSPEREQNFGANPPSPARIEPGVGYGVSYRAEEGLWHGPRATLEVLAPSGWGGRAELTSALPHTEAFGAVELEFLAAALTLAPVWRSSGSHFSVGGFVGPSLEWVRYTPLPDSDADVTPGEAASTFRPAASAGALLSIGRGPRIGLVLEASVAFVRNEYKLETNTGRERVGRASWISPTAGLEVSF